jgi:S-adenosylmethionine:tRNA ribosyltransferase-isomerase
MFTIDLEEYNYGLPQQRIAQYPVKERDESLLLLYRNNEISKDYFKNIYRYIPSGSLLVFNNTKVIRARILFNKPTGSSIEVFCLEPLAPSDYEFSLSSKSPLEWKCIIGNQKKWKGGSLEYNFICKGRHYRLSAEKTGQNGESVRIRFLLDPPELTFGEVLESTGHIPLPPYIRRKEIAEDYQRYQTVYSSVKGSVAAPTAGLHFTDKVLGNIRAKGIDTTELTLHVGAGTFKPVKSDNLAAHEMHTEHFYVTKKAIETLHSHTGKIFAVGTTTVRTLESLYWSGVKIAERPEAKAGKLDISQWEPYNNRGDIEVRRSFEAILSWMNKNGTSTFQSSTGLMIVPGYKFRTIKGLITNFHQPKSTLLLLISAWIGDNWKKIYNFAAENDFRFLSYGDSSLLIK